MERRRLCDYISISTT
jgi:hypothetical protein